jgi:hypothetical protein
MCARLVFHRPRSGYWAPRFHPKSGLPDFGTLKMSEIGHIRFHPKSGLPDFGTLKMSEIGHIRFRGARHRPSGLLEFRS